MQVLGEDISMLDAFKAANEVLHGAVAGIAEVISCPGLVNVDFADVRTVMSEMGMAMMGSAVPRVLTAHPAAEQAVASPLLEDVNLVRGARRAGEHHGQRGLKMKEVHEVMNTIRVHSRGRHGDRRNRDRRGHGRRAAGDDGCHRPGAAGPQGRQQPRR